MDISLPSDLSEFVRKQVESGTYPSETAVLTEAVKQLKDRAPVSPTNGQEQTPAIEHKPIWEVIEEIMRDVPDEELACLPVDGAEQVDHYIYGTPKR
jgi:Arc/MetJ-type ribon-helix-helix transcriptional regulator